MSRFSNELRIYNGLLNNSSSSTKSRSGPEKQILKQSIADNALNLKPERSMLTREQITSVLLRHQLALTAFIASIARSFHLAEDVFQEVCMNAIGRQESFESEQHLLNWARLHGRHRAIDALRARDGKYNGLSDEVLDQLGTAFETNRLANCSDKHEALRECIQSLTPNNYEILRLRYFEGRTTSAIAELLDRKLATVYQSIARIHKSLGDCISSRLLEMENR